jgi:protein pelota
VFVLLRLLPQASSAYKHSLKEVLALPAVASKIKDTKAAREVGALQDFYAMLTADSSRAFYGPGHVLAAAELGAIQTLLISGACVRVCSVWACNML